MNQPNLYTINQIKESENIYIKKNSLNKLFDNATTKIVTFIKKTYNKKKNFICLRSWKQWNGWKVNI